MFEEEEEQQDEGFNEFSAVAQEIYSQAPDSDSGLAALRDAYSSYDFVNADRAKEVFTSFSDETRKRFGDTKAYDFQKITETAPIPFEAIPGEGETEEDRTVDSINKWETENLKAIEEADDPVYLQSKNQLQRGIQQAATLRRRELYGGDNNYVVDMSIRAAQGAVGGVAKAVGLTSVNDWFEQNTDKDNDDDFFSALASGVGSVVGAVSSAAAATLAAPVVGASALVGGAVGAGAYLFASGAGEVREQVENSLEAGGSVGEAAAAGGIEAASQLGQSLVGGKVFGKVGAQLVKRAAPLGARAFAKIAGAGLAEGTAEGLGQIASNVASNVGMSQNEDVTRGAGTAFAVGGILGSGASVVGNIAATDPLQETIEQIDGTPPPPKESIPVPYQSVDLPGEMTVLSSSDGIDYVTDGEKLYTRAGDKAVGPFDRNFFISPDEHAKVAKVARQHAPDGTVINVVTEDGKLYVESDFVNEDLTLSDTKTGKSRVEVKASTVDEGGYHPVGADTVRTVNGVREANYFVGPKPLQQSVGAAFVGDFGVKARKATTDLIAKYGAEYAEDMGAASISYTEDAQGNRTQVVTPLWNYLPKADTKTNSIAGKMLAEKGYIRSIADLKTKDIHTDDEQVLRRLMENNIKTAFVEKASTAKTAAELQEVARLKDLLGEVTELKGIMSTPVARSLRAIGSAEGDGALQGNTDVASILTSLHTEAQQQIESELGKGQNIDTIVQEVEAAEAEAKAVETEVKEVLEQKRAAQPKVPSKDGVKSPEPTLSPTDPVAKKQKAVQEKVTQTRNKLTRAQQIQQETLGRFNPEDRQQLLNLHKLVETLEDGGVKQKAVETIFNLNSKYANTPQDFDRLHTYWRMNVLSGGDTQIRNIIGTATGQVSSAVTNLVTGLAGDVANLVGVKNNMSSLDAASYVRGSLEGLWNAKTEALEIMKGNRQGRRNQEMTGNINEGILKVPKGALPKAWYAARFGSEMMRRVMSASDALLYNSAVTGQARLAEHVAARVAKVPIAERRAWISEKLYGTKEAQRLAKEKINSQRDSLASIGVKMTDTEAELAFYEMMERNRSERTQEISRRHGEKTILINKADGALGVVAGLISDANKKTKMRIGTKTFEPMKYIVPFANTAANAGNLMLEHTPFGLAKSTLRFKRLKADAKAAGKNIDYSLEQREVAGRMLIGSTAMAGLFATALEYMDDEDPWFDIRGKIPKGQYDTWMQQNKTEYSIKIGNSQIGTKGTPLALAVALIAGARDSVKAGGDPMAVAKNLAAVSALALSDMTMLKQVSDVFSTISGSNSQEPATTEGGKEKQSKAFENWFKGAVSNAVTPFIPSSGLLKTAERWMSASPIETYNNFSAKFLGQLPVVSGLVMDQEGNITGAKPKLNVLGKPITRDFVDRTAIRDFFTKETTDPNLLWLQESGHSITPQGPIIRMTDKEERAFSVKQKTEFGYQDILTEEQSREVLELSGPKIDALLTSIRNNPSFKTKTEETQSYINKYINKIRAEARYRVLSKKK